MERIAWRAALPALGVLLLTVLVYSPALSGGYLWDDDALIVENWHVRADDGLRRLWFSREPFEYLPLTYSMHWAEWRLFGGSAAGPHAINVLLHGLSAALLGLLLQRLRAPGAWLAALFFALHPVAVSSAAWLSERKNTLSMALYLGSLLAYLKSWGAALPGGSCAVHSAEGGGAARFYLLSLGLFLLALLAKTSVVMMPVVLLLMTWWQRGAVTRSDGLRTAPFFALSLVFGLVTVWFQWHNAIGHEVVRPEGAASRIAAAGWIVWFYLYKLLLPTGLCAIYPRWTVDGSSVLSFLPLALLAAVAALLWRRRNRWGAGPLVAWAYFVISLLPVMGFVDMSFMRLSLVADHLQYVAMPGILALAAGLLARAADGGTAQRRAATAAAGVCLAALAALTFQRAGVFSDEQRLWRDNVEKAPRSTLAWCDLGATYRHAGTLDEAIRCFDKSLELDPRFATAWYNRGTAHALAGRTEQALHDLDRAIALRPDYAEAYGNRGNIHAAAQRYAEAIRDYDRAIAANPRYAEAWYNRGIAHAAVGKPAEAVRDFSRVIELRPWDTEAYVNRAAAHSRLNQDREALADLEMARRLGASASRGP